MIEKSKKYLRRLRWKTLVVFVLVWGFLFRLAWNAAQSIETPETQVLFLLIQAVFCTVAAASVAYVYLNWSKDRWYEGLRREDEDG
jgi:type VI protein secretion system component VasK